MKKLIALTLCLALVLSFSFAAMAATSTTTYNAETGVFTTIVTADVGDQATLIAFPASGLDTTGSTNIEFIDQATTTAGATVFTYKFKNTVVANQAYTIKVGGSLLATPLSETITPVVAATGYTVSGTVLNVAAPLPLQDFTEGFGDEAVAQAFIANCAQTWATKVKLIPEIQLHRIIKNIFDSSTYPTDTSVAVVPQVTVDPVAQTYSLSNVPNGTYWLVFERAGFVTLFSKVVVDGANVPVSSKSLIAGDTHTNRDLVIDSADTSAILLNSASFDNPDVILAYDITSDASIDSGDTSLVLQNSGFDYSSTDADFYSLDIDTLIGFQE